MHGAMDAEDELMEGLISVLLVERDPQAAQLLLLLLAAPDARRFETVLVVDLGEGRRILEGDENIDAVILGLPIDGGRLRERLRSLRRQAPGIPVVAAVEAGAEALGREAVALGAEAFWVRSPDAGALRRALAAAVARGASARREEAAIPVFETAGALA